MKKRTSLLLLLLVAPACTLDGMGTGGYVTPEVVETTPLRGDAFPAGAVSYFKKLACPEGWKPYEAAAGRTIVAASEALPAGAVVGEPLASQEERSHHHAISTTVEIPKVSYVGISGGGNGGVGTAGAVTLATTSEPAPSDVPYVQLLACKKTAEPVPRSAPLPPRLLVFFDAEVCPEGFRPAEGTEGRLLVGLPPYAPADRPFGGEPFTSAEPRAHEHAFASTLETSSHGIALLGGCCADGYAKSGAYELAGTTELSEVDVPLLALLQCEKE